MYNNKTFLAIIPARGGSKGLPGKNIKPILGKPLLQWTIEAGKNSKYIDELVVSTDSNEIAEVAKNCHAAVPFMRPDHLSGDTATSFVALKHAIDFYSSELQKEFDFIIKLEATSPLRTAEDIDRAIETLMESDADAIVGIGRTEDQNPAFLVRLDNQNRISGYVNPDMTVIRRQDVDDIYFFEGSLYISKTDVLLEKKTFYHSNTLGHIMPKYKTLEIDDIDDFVMVEALMKQKCYK